MTAKIRLDDIGTSFEPTIKDENGAIIDVSTSITRELVFLKPSGAVLVRNATFKTNGTDGILKYVSVAGDLDEIGEWKVQGHVETGTSDFRSDIHSFNVYANLPVV